MAPVSPVTPVQYVLLERLVEGTSSIVEDSVTEVPERRRSVEVDHIREVMDSVLVVRVIYVDTGRGECLGVLEAFVAQWVISRGEYRRRRKPLEITLKRRGKGIVPIGGERVVSEIVIPKPHHRPPGKKVPFAVRIVRLGVVRVVRDRIQEHLVIDCWATDVGVGSQLRDDGCEVPTSRLANHS